MMWHGHAASGLVAGELVEPFVPHVAGTATPAIFLAVCVVGALAPDLDHRDGKLSHSLGPITWVLCRIVVHLSKGLFIATRGPRDFKNSNGHRGVTHAPVFAPVVAVGVWIAVPGAVAWPVGLGVLVGVLAHQAGDACTNSGIPMLWPFMGRGVNRGKRWAHHGIPKALRFETGGEVETAITWGLYSLCVLVPIGELYLGVRLF